MVARWRSLKHTSLVHLHALNRELQDDLLFLHGGSIISELMRSEVRDYDPPQIFSTQRMSGFNFSVFLTFVFVVCSTVQVKTETEIFCVFMQRCVLLCSFQGSSDVFIHWFQLKAGLLRVHSYYNNMDQLDLQNQNFKNRTSLFQDQLSRGNASLLLTGVKVEDQSRYRCYCGTISESKNTFLQLSVDAPVSDIRIHQDGNRITCSSEGIYPPPELTWSTEPPSNTTLHESTRIQETEDKLYNISSSLTVPDGSDRTYSCTIRTRRNQKRATLRQESVIVSSRQTSLSCFASNVSVSKLLWRFNHSQVIVSRSGQSRATVTEEWKRHVKSVSESGGLSQQDLSPQQDGIYTCELSNQEETFVSSTFLKVEEDRGGTRRHPGVSIAVAAAAVIILCVVLILCRNQKDLDLLTLINKKLSVIYLASWCAPRPCRPGQKANRTDTDMCSFLPEVSCVFLQLCVLPCSFQSHGDDVIHWFHHKGSKLRVHSYYHNQDQNFRGRTSLFLDQISRGNASLLLTGVKVQNEGFYRCYTSTIYENRDTFMNLLVNAPVSTIRIHQDGNRITCSSEGIYPQPELTWSTEPPSNTVLHESTRIQETEDKLYNISSSLTVPDGSDWTYSCTIRTRRNQRRATFRKLSVSVSGGVSTIPCLAPVSSLQNFSLTWRFNHSQTVATQTAGSTFTASDGWRKRVEGVSESGSLTLSGLSSSQDGVYSCELSDEEQTLVTDILLTTQEGGHGKVAVLVFCVLTVIVLAALLVASLMVHEKNQPEPNSVCLQTELEMLQSASTPVSPSAESTS
ncbi:uncharacterized protein LOC122824650 [Gambusia affinis]|uniref:uncharacterized protein LOC122824650 n=1 Tax=Gambusia affinis TaxID=33528 RepID=UPI001CDCF5DF|nr:uncharacterized protein LOC122824650 [Gambusia affinis]